MNRVYLLPLAALAFWACSDRVPTEPGPHPGALGPSLIVAGAGFTTTNPDVDPESPLVGPLCFNGPGIVNCNSYGAKQFVWTNGGPTNGANELTDGTYFFAVVEPSGQSDPNDGSAENLSDDFDAYTNRTFTVTDGKISAYSGSHDFYPDPQVAPVSIRLYPYATTTNNGGVYIMELCRIDTQESYDATTKTYDVENDPVAPSSCKTDAFKAAVQEECAEPPCQPPTEFGLVTGKKYYDANLNGQKDPGEVGIANWPINWTDGASGTEYTDNNGDFSLQLTEDTYYFAEQVANFPWFRTGNTVDQTSTTGGSTASLSNYVYTVDVVDGSTTSGLFFGNVCIGGGTGALTIGYWQNKNGNDYASTKASDLRALNLRYGAIPGAPPPINGSNYDPSNFAWSGKSSLLYTAWKYWLTSANASNMAYMLSAQMAGMYLNVWSGKVDGNAYIYAPGTDAATNAGLFGFAKVNDVLSEANTLLYAGGAATLVIGDGSALRPRATALKDALDKANNNLNFLQPGPNTCPTPTFTLLF